MSTSQIWGCARPSASNCPGQKTKLGVLYVEYATREGQGIHVIANNLSKAGWSWGCVSAIDSYGS